MAAKKPAAKSNDTKARSSKALVKSTTTSKRAAAVDRNLGQSQKLRDFLTGAGWD